MKVVATAYAGDTITATGTKPKWGTIAVDPRVIPYGTKVYIPQFNMTFVAEDCGGAIKNQDHLKMVLLKRKVVIILSR